MPKRANSILVALAFGAAFALASWLRLSATDRYFASQRPEDIYYVPTAAWLPSLSMGHRSALADLLWMKALVYFGEGIAGSIPLAHVFDYGEAILTLDPTFERVYRWVGTAGMYHPGETTVDEIRRSITYLERGVRQFPESGELAWELGSALTFELVPRLPHGDPERDTARARGTHFLTIAARRGAGPAWLALTNASQFVRLGQRERAIEHLREMYAITKDETVKQQIADRIAELSDAATREGLLRAFDEAERDRVANYPYLPGTLYDLVGPRSVLEGSELDPLALLRRDEGLEAR